MHISARIVMPILVLGIVNVSSIFVTRTQYYIMLPGVFFLFLAVLFCLYSVSENRALWSLLAGVSLGLSFYSYFCYIFFLPAFLWMLYKRVKNKTQNLLICCIGVIAGSTLYFVGYFEAVMINMVYSEKWQIILGVVFCILFLCCIGAVIGILLKANSDNNYVKKVIQLIGIVIGCAIILGIVLVVCKRTVIIDKLGHFASLDLSEEKVTFWERILFFLQYFGYCTTMNFPCHAIFGEKVLFFTSVYVVCLIICIFYMCVFRDKFKENILIKWSLYSVISFFVCSFGIITRMQSQHFVAFYFIIYIVLGVVVNELVQKRMNKIICSFVGASCIIINLCNLQNISTELYRTGGKGGYADTINQEAKIALEEYEKGQKDVYISLEWGFKAGFIYLTNNKVLCNEYINDTDNISNWDISEFLNDGYRVILVSNSYDKILENENYFEVEGQKRIYNAGNDFYMYMSTIE